MDAEHGLVEDPTAPDKVVLETESGSYGSGTAQVLRRYPRIHGNRLGLCKQTKASLSLKPGTRPVFRPKRPVPYAALSRLIANRQPPNEDAMIASVDAKVQRIFIDAVRSLPLTAETIRAETSKDSLLQEIMSFMQRGWPQEKTGQILQFFNRRDSLSVFGGCLLSGERVVIPVSLQRLVLCQLHRGHPGIVKMKALARSHVYRPGLDNQIEELVKRCNRCASVAKLPLKTTLALGQCQQNHGRDSTSTMQVRLRDIISSL
ncbi:hypothetical protein M514_12771 [Trichuris suis]|uniref:RNA-directed DNA polymerase n=1 Tax=Trichuris suis TaxID=68888 RepID=A0A085N0B0_9BILA|nr:hypothetical protein M513_12771 [Trichuris suis]KFD62906.1 hypothetical protein M514_12771 [Trichuris suis]KHJ41553.1 hypothetical protein D918_08405 [Trichuris suis]